MFFNKLRTVLEMIKFEHSVFALPFALTGALLALRESGLEIASAGEKFAWIIVAMVAARSAAMAFNRVADAEIDGRASQSCSLSCHSITPARRSPGIQPAPR